MVSVSVVIPVHRGGALLARALDALENQTVAPVDVWAIGYSKSVPPELEGRSRNFSYGAVHSRWPAFKRNEGARRAKGDWIAFLDEDCVPDRDWIERIVETAEMHSSVDLIEGQTLGEFVHLLGHSLENAVGGWYPTCNVAVRKKAFEDIGGFDENYTFFREDLDLAFAFERGGKNLLFASSVRVFHPERPMAARQVLNELDMIRGDVRLAKKFPEQYRRRLGKFGWNGGFKLAFLQWALLVLAIGGALTRTWGITLGAIVATIVFRYILYMRGKKATLSQAAGFLFFTACRDLAFPLYGAYFWLTEKP